MKSKSWVCWLPLTFMCAACAPPAKPANVVDVPTVSTQTPLAAPVAVEAAPTPTGAPGKLLPNELAFVADVQGRKVLVVDTDAQEGWRAAPPTLLTSTTGPIVLGAPVTFQALPASHRLSHETFSFYRGNQVLCKAELGALSLTGQLEQMGMDWAGSAQRTPPATPREIADEAWGYASKWLIAEIRLPAGCEGARWARASALPAPMFAEPLVLTDDTAHRAFAAFEALPAHAEIGKQYDDWTASLPGIPGAPPQSTKNPSWSDDSIATRFSKAYTWRGQRYIGVGATIDNTCAFNASLFSLYRIQGAKLERTGTRVSAPPEGMLVDLNLDGRLEMVTGATDPGLQGVAPFEDLEGPSFDLTINSPGCPC